MPPWSSGLGYARGGTADEVLKGISNCISGAFEPLQFSNCESASGSSTEIDFTNGSGLSDSLTYGFDILHFK
jgi:hypothetical protein